MLKTWKALSTPQDWYNNSTYQKKRKRKKDSYNNSKIDHDRALTVLWMNIQVQ